MTDGSSEKGVPPPGAAVAYRRILKDPRDEPQYAERVPYIVSNADGRRLIDRARMPEEMLVNRYEGDLAYIWRLIELTPIGHSISMLSTISEIS
jgi:DNA polymerase zeta